ncbi:helix-turn-helix domain-containing protein [Haemophilus influenzae]|uniref:helix-turn-helix domain-containing protein n=1 Tax=Haemophilus influenzae TaxID=727 RepID=UPI000CFEEDA2|nr:helix-turn-helix transcriptional regulator [Haemophilus influenzae]PRJ53666.1 helix-turn-helix protein [Haemophilus influenzae]PRL42549.1 helix-turn-helix protein [Haemophilus influenzae]
MGMHDKIRMMRELRQLSQEDMAEKMNMSPSGYAKIERGETRLQYDKLVQIAQIFNVSLSDLVDNDKGVIFFMNKNGNNTSANYYSGDHSIMFEIEKLKLQLIHKDELLAQKEKELVTLRKMISLLEK